MECIAYLTGGLQLSLVVHTRTCLGDRAWVTVLGLDDCAQIAVMGATRDVEVNASRRRTESSECRSQPKPMSHTNWLE